MKSRNKTWEVIAAGCAFMALSVYLLHTPDATPSSPDKMHEIHIEIPEPPEAPSAPKTIIIDPDNLESLEEELGNLEEELKKLEIELQSETTLQSNVLSLPSLKSLPKILIYSQ